MFDRLEDLLIRYEEVMGELQEPGVADDPVRFRKLMKEQSDLAPIVEAYNEYKQCRQNIEDSLAMLEEESDEEMKELAKEELNESKANVERLEEELKILLIPKDPDDDKDVICEIRAGAGGEEAALFAGTLFRMYSMYAEKKHWKLEILNEINVSGVRGFDSHGNHEFTDKNGNVGLMNYLGEIIVKAEYYRITNENDFYYRVAKRDPNREGWELFYYTDSKGNYLDNNITEAQFFYAKNYFVIYKDYDYYFYDYKNNYLGSSRLGLTLDVTQNKVFEQRDNNE